MIGLVIGLYLDYTLIPLWVGISAVWLVLLTSNPQKLRSILLWLVFSACAWILYLPWFSHLQIMLQRLNDVVFFNRIQSLLGLPPFSAEFYLAGLAIAGLGVFLVAMLFTRWLQSHTLHQNVKLTFLMFFGCVILLFAFPRFYTIKRILVTGWFLVILFVTWVTVQLNRHKNRVWQGLLLVSMLSSLITLVTPKDDWRSVAEFLNQKDISEAVIWVDPAWDRLAYNYYAPLQEVKYGSLRELQEVGANNEIWLIAERFLGQPVPSSDSEVWLDRHLELGETVSFYRLELRHYFP
jgi:hypothetical protein